MEPTESPSQDSPSMVGILPVIREHIVSTPDTCGGKPRIAGSRIRVKDVVMWHVRQGMTPAEIVSKWPHLTLASIFAALAYYHDHREEINAEITANRAWYEVQKAKSPSLVRERLKMNMTPQAKAESLGITFTRQEPGYLALVVRTGDLLITSGHVSDIKGKLGAGLTVDEGKAAARECAVKILNSVWNAHGTLDGLRVLKLLGCVNSTLDFDEQHLVINGCSDLLHEVYGKTGDGHHARSALGFAQLPTGVAVEVEAIFEIKA